MKIEIEFNSSTDATITVDGRVFHYRGRPTDFGSRWGFDDMPKRIRERTIGGIVACKLVDDLSTILQNWMPEETKENGDIFETFDVLPLAVAEKIEMDGEIEGF